MVELIVISIMVAGAMWHGTDKYKDGYKNGYRQAKVDWLEDGRFDPLHKIGKY